MSNVPVQGSRRERWLVAVVFSLSLIGLFAPYSAGGASLLSASHDASSLFIGGAKSGQAFSTYWKVLDPNGSDLLSEPDAMLERRQIFQEHQLPLWDPDAAMGTPELAAMQPQSFSPFQIPMLLHPGRLSATAMVITRLFVAGYFAFLFFRLFLSCAGAVAGGVASMLGGYFLLFSTQPYLSVEVLLPAYLFTLEVLMRARRWTSIGWAAFICTVVLFGGMPESALLLLAYGAAWITVRVGFDPILRPCWSIALLRYIAATALGVAGGAILLVPFADYIPVAFDAHQAANVGVAVGAVSTVSPDLQLLALFMMPLLFGPPHPNAALGSVLGHAGTVNFASASAFFLAILGIVTARRCAVRARTPLWFFITMLALLELKVFGNPAVNWIGYLPLFSLVNYAKYTGPLVSITFAALVAYGVAALSAGRLRLWELSLAVSVMVGLFALAIDSTAAQAVSTVDPARRFYGSAAFGAAAALALTCCLSASIWFVQRIGPGKLPTRTQAAILAAIILTLGVEQSANYFIPMYWVLDRGPVPAPNPYAGAPYIDFLRKATVDHERVFAAPGLLEPHWASAFGLQDIRDADALTYRSYVRFIRAFLPAENRASADLAFIGRGLSSPLSERLLTLTSVGLVAGTDTSPDWNQRDLTRAFYQRIYRDDVQVFRFLRPIPRVGIYRSLTVVPNDQDALAMLSRPDFNPFRSVVVTSEGAASLPPSVRAMQGMPAKNVAAARIVAYRANSVQIETDDSNSGRVLMLNDTNLPGWRASVDGSPSKMFAADYLFRGVYVPQGRHRVDFRFEPWGFGAAAWISVVALLASVTLILFDALRPAGAKGSLDDGYPPTAT